MIKKSLIVLIGLTMWASPMLHASDGTSTPKSPVKIKKSLEKNYLKIKKKKYQKKKAQRDISYLNREIKKLELQKKRNYSKLKNNRKKLKDSEQSIKNLEEELENKKVMLGKRINQIYRTKSIGFAEIFLVDSKLPIFLESYILKKILKADVDLVKDVTDQYASLEEEKEKLETYQKEIKSLSTKISKQEKNLESAKSKKKTTIKNLDSEIAAIEKRNEELRIASIQIASEVLKGSLGKHQFFGKGKFIRPVKGWLSSRYGWRRHPIYKRRILHRGVDFAAPTGHKIRASESGIVLVAGQKRKYRGYGKITIIDHGTKSKKRYSTVYAHQSRIFVKEGDYVSRGDVIGWVGSTGNSTGPHLHFEIRVNGTPKDPLKYIKL